MKTLLQSSVNALPGPIRRAIKYMPGVAATQRWLVRHYLDGHTFVHRLNAGPAAGLRFEVTLPQDKGIWTGTYEFEFTSAIVKQIQRDDVCYDIGGYRGFVSGAMALAGASRVFVFEPLPANRKALARVIELNPELPVSALSYAISESEGSAEFRVMPDSSMGALADSGLGRETKQMEVIPVEVRQIDSLVQSQEILPADVIKIDVEGAELGVLKGSVNLLRERRPKVFLEAHSAALESACSEFLVALGYNMRRIEREVRSENSVRHLICLSC